MLLVTTFVERLFFCARWIVLAQPAEAQAPQRRASAASTASSLPMSSGAGSGLDCRRQPRGALTAWTAALWRLMVSS
jgi:hypothetical protein